MTTNKWKKCKFDIEFYLEIDEERQNKTQNFSER